MKIQDVLKELYEAMGGKPKDVADMSVTTDIISAMAALIKSNGGIAFAKSAKKDNKEKE